MTDLPTKSFLTSTTTTEVQFQNAIGDLYEVVKQNFGLGPAEALTIASGSVTPTRGIVNVDTENGDPADNLDLIVPTSIGEKIIILSAVSAARPVTLRHNQSGTGKLNLRGAANVTLYDPTYTIALLWNATTSKWDELWRNFGLYTTQSSEITAIQTALGLGTAAYKNTGTSTGQIPLKENFGTAAFVNTGTSSGQVPLANQLGSLAFLSQVTNSQLDGSGVTPGTYNQLTVNAQGRVTAGANVAGVNAQAIARAWGNYATGFNQSSISVGGGVVSVGISGGVLSDANYSPLITFGHYGTISGSNGTYSYVRPDIQKNTSGFAAFCVASGSAFNPNEFYWVVFR